MAEKNGITLKEYIDCRLSDIEVAAAQRFDAQQLAVKDALVNQEKAVNAALLASEKAIIKAEILTDKRFDGVTKSITELSDQTGNLLPRAEYAANHGALNDKITVATDAINRSSGDKNLYATNAYVTQTVNQAIDSLETKMAAILTPLVDYVASQKGVAQGSQLTFGKMLGMITVMGAIIGIIFTLGNIFIK